MVSGIFEFGLGSVVRLIGLALPVAVLSGGVKLVVCGILVVLIDPIEVSIRLNRGRISVALRVDATPGDNDLGGRRQNTLGDRLAERYPSRVGRHMGNWVRRQR